MLHSVYLCLRILPPWMAVGNRIPSSAYFEFNFVINYHATSIGRLAGRLRCDNSLEQNQFELWTQRTPTRSVDGCWRRMRRYLHILQIWLMIWLHFWSLKMVKRANFGSKLIKDELQWRRRRRRRRTIVSESQKTLDDWINFFLSLHLFLLSAVIAIGFS